MTGTAPEDRQEESVDATVHAEVEAVLAEFDGDARAAIAALLHDLATLASDHARTVSFGYVRGRMPGQGRG